MNVRPAFRDLSVCLPAAFYATVPVLIVSLRGRSGLVALRPFVLFENRCVIERARSRARVDQG
jgi:hypothetical protein